MSTPTTPRQAKTRSNRRIPPGAWPVPPDAPEVEIEVIPGKKVKTRMPLQVPRYALMTVIQDPDGSCRIGPIVWSQYIPMGLKVPQQLGLPIHYNTLRRLTLMGAVECSHPTPETLLLNAASLLQHLRRTRIQPGKPSWWTPERREAWKLSVAGSTMAVPE